ncbi:MAG: hypothetical protein V4574_22035 [Pseudomonadota bacterium]
MPDVQVLLVLAVQEAGLRSALAAQLAMAGASLITTGDIDNPALLRGVRRPAVLVLDGPTAAERPADWLAAALDDLRWLQVVLLTAAAEAQADPHPKLLRLEARGAVRILADRIPQWREDCARVA